MSDLAARAGALPIASRATGPGWWGRGITALALLLALPVLVVVGFLFVPSGDVWQHLADTVLADYVTNSLLLMAGVTLGTLIGGVGTAWLTSMCRFPGRGCLRVGPAPAHGHARLHHRLYLHGAPRLRRSRADGAACRHRLGLWGLLVPPDQVPARGGGDAGPGPLPLCVPAGPRGLSRANPCASWT